ncbi:hypothetical protein E2562_000310 [Oryza meyeriana var. granulata]|uniref:Uncharacterized protein n=1 Tax=Oryza meyeriana var. granulata TaxID=110450 RepID=A0A6G1CMQ9_9ORYZ|nr:hypothetical protein E2562_000310 [Oryza meyeriana var. granulata]
MTGKCEEETREKQAEQCADDETIPSDRSASGVVQGFEGKRRALVQLFGLSLFRPEMEGFHSLGRGCPYGGNLGVPEHPPPAAAPGPRCPY